LDKEKPDYIPQKQWDAMKEHFDEIYEDYDDDTDRLYNHADS
jgi:hypothetical protein